MPFITRCVDRARSMLFVGYSFKSNEFGLSVDNVVSYDLVLPNGTITKITSDDTDLWFGLRVGYNAANAPRSC